MEKASPEIPGRTRVGRVALRVNDLDGTCEFYERVIGLDVRHRGEARAVLGAGDESLLELIADPDAPERGRAETGLFHAAFLVPSRAALGDALERVEERWRLDGASDHLVSEALYLSDPEDNGIELYCDRPRDRWPVADDGTVDMATAPLDLDGLRALSRGEAGVPAGTTVGHVHLEVSSLPASREFYADALGLRVRRTDGASAAFLAAGDYHHHVGLNVWNRRTEPATGRGLERFELVLPDSDALDSIRRRFDERGIATTTTDDGFEAADPDGIVLSVVNQ